MRKQLKVIFDLLEKIHVAGPEVDIMATVRVEMVRLDQMMRNQSLRTPAVGIEEPGVGENPGEPGVVGEEARNE